MVLGYLGFKVQQLLLIAVYETFHAPVAVKNKEAFSC